MPAAHSSSAGIATAAHPSATARAKNDTREPASEASAGAPRTALLSAATTTRIASVLRGVGGDQGAHYAIGPGQSAAYALIVAIELSLIVSENNNGAASIPAPLPPDVVGGVEHGSGDIGAAVESLVAKQPVKPALHFLAAIVK